MKPDQLLALFDYWEREKGISRNIVAQAIKEMIETAAKKAIGPARHLHITINPKTGHIQAQAKLIVVQKIQSPHDEITLTKARQHQPDIQPNDEIQITIPPDDLGQIFGRIAAQISKQNFRQHLRRIEKQLIYTEFKDRTGDIVSGTVRRFERSDVILDLGRYEAILPNHERVPTEEYQIGERLRCLVKTIADETTGPEIILSRADPKFVIKLFQVEVTEINDNTIEIKSIAREPGYRTKLAVHSHDSKVDPVGACVGLRGQRVKNIVRELNNEKVDIIPWDPNPRTFISNALSPAKLIAFEPDPDRRRIRVLVDPNQLSLAIGKRGQNARLTSRLCACNIDIQPYQPTEIGFDQKVAQAIQSFAAIDGINPDQAAALVHNGFHTLDTLLEIQPTDLQEIPQLAPHAQQILQAAQAESQRRQRKLEETQ